MTPRTPARSVPGSFPEPEFTENDFLWREDCRHFVGGLPCKYWRPCRGCDHYDPVNYRVLIVMLGLLGDMLIASPLPARIKRDHPHAHITWLVDDGCAPVLRMNPYIDRVLPFDWHAATHLASETFNAVYSFERTPSAAALVDRIQATHKAGLAYGGPHNSLYALGEAARHFFLMNTWNEYFVATPRPGPSCTSRSPATATTANPTCWKFPLPPTNEPVHWSVQAAKRPGCVSTSEALCQPRSGRVSISSRSVPHSSIRAVGW